MNGRAKINAGMAATICTALVLAVVFVSEIRHRKITGKSPSEHQTPSVSDINKWLKYLSDNELKSAALQAGRFADDSFNYPPPQDYLLLLQIYNISSSVITGPFNEFDAERWNSAFLAAKIAERIENENPQQDFPHKLLSYFKENFQIVKRTSPAESVKSIAELLNRKELSLNETFRFANEIAEQAGYLTAVITLHGKNEEQLHSLMELRKNNYSVVIDFQNNIICENRSVQSLMKNADTGNEQLNLILSAANFARYHIPSEIQDFKSANGELYSNIKKYCYDLQIPVFGRDPNQKLKENILVRKGENIPESLFAYWHYPFWLYAEIKNSELKKTDK